MSIKVTNRNLVDNDFYHIYIQIRFLTLGKEYSTT